MAQLRSIKALASIQVVPAVLGVLVVIHLLVRRASVGSEVLAEPVDLAQISISKTSSPLSAGQVREEAGEAQVLFRKR